MVYINTSAESAVSPAEYCTPINFPVSGFNVLAGASHVTAASAKRSSGFRENRSARSRLSWSGAVAPAVAEEEDG